jgi:four helix bundle protein
MTQPFGHEKLIVYQKGMHFVAMRSALLARLARIVAACDHLDRGAESILVNIAHASNTGSPKERIVYLGHANGSALECAACLDVLVAKALLATEDVYPGKSLLAEIVSILITMRKTTANRVCEDHAQYRTKRGNLFDHEDLDVYQVALQIIAWLDPLLMKFSCSADLRLKLDKSTTAIVLNIAEGNGRFTGADQSKFYETAYKATIRSASFIDLAGGNGIGDAARVEEGRELLRRVAAMLTALSKVATHE